MSDWKIVLLIIIIGAIGILNIINSNSNKNPNYNRLIHLDTISILNNDKEFMIDLKESNLNRIRQIENKYKDSIASTVVLELLKEVLDEKGNNTKNIQRQKNEEIFSFKSEYYQLKDNNINIWLIIFIILISGLLGGFARTKYSDLVNLSESMNEAEQAVATMESSITSFKETIPLHSFTTVKGKLREAQNVLKEVREEDGEKVFINIIFGIIASALSFIALTTFSSDVLKFDLDIDYFIFLGWCLLGAVFAKNWIMSLYNRITGKTGN